MSENPRKHQGAHPKFPNSVIVTPEEIFYRMRPRNNSLPPRLAALQAQANANKSQNSNIQRTQSRNNNQQNGTQRNVNKQNNGNIANNNNDDSAQQKQMRHRQRERIYHNNQNKQNRPHNNNAWKAVNEFPQMPVRNNQFAQYETPNQQGRKPDGNQNLPKTKTVPTSTSTSTSTSIAGPSSPTYATVAARLTMQGSDSGNAASGMQGAAANAPGEPFSSIGELEITPPAFSYFTQHPVYGQLPASTEREVEGFREAVNRLTLLADSISLHSESRPIRTNTESPPHPDRSSPPDPNSIWNWRLVPPTDITQKPPPVPKLEPGAFARAGCGASAGASGGVNTVWNPPYGQAAAVHGLDGNVASGFDQNSVLYPPQQSASAGFAPYGGMCDLERLASWGNKKCRTEDACCPTNIPLNTTTNSSTNTNTDIFLFDTETVEPSNLDSGDSSVTSLNYLCTNIDYFHGESCACTFCSFKPESSGCIDSKQDIGSVKSASITNADHFQLSSAAPAPYNCKTSSAAAKSRFNPTAVDFDLRKSTSQAEPSAPPQFSTSERRRPSDTEEHLYFAVPDPDKFGDFYVPPDVIASLFKSLLRKNLHKPDLNGGNYVSNSCACYSKAISDSPTTSTYTKFSYTGGMFLCQNELSPVPFRMLLTHPYFADLFQHVNPADYSNMGDFCLTYYTVYRPQANVQNTTQTPLPQTSNTFPQTSNTFPQTSNTFPQTSYTLPQTQYTFPQTQYTPYSYPQTPINFPPTTQYAESPSRMPSEGVRPSPDMYRTSFDVDDLFYQELIRQSILAARRGDGYDFFDPQDQRPN